MLKSPRRFFALMLFLSSFVSVFAAVIDINPRDVKGSQILLDRVPDVIEAGQVDLVVFQRKTSCTPDIPTTFFGLKGGLSFSQTLRQRYCAAISGTVAANTPLLATQTEPLRTFAKSTLVSEQIPTRSVLQTLAELGIRKGGSRYTLMVDWYAAHMDESTKYTHLVFEIVLFDAQVGQSVWHSIVSTYNITDSNGGIKQDSLVRDVKTLISDLGFSILTRQRAIDLKMTDASVLRPEKFDTAQLILINDYNDGGYDTYGQSIGFHKLRDASASPDIRIDAYPTLPANSAGLFRLLPGHYALLSSPTDHLKLEVVEGRTQTIKMTRGLFNRTVLTALSESEGKQALAKARNAFFPDPAKQGAILEKATWAND